MTQIQAEGTIREAIDAFKPYVVAEDAALDYESVDYRAARVLVPLAMYAYRCEGPNEPLSTIIQDFLSDLRHLIDRTDDGDFHEIEVQAEARYQEELAGVLPA